MNTDAVKLSKLMNHISDKEADSVITEAVIYGSNPDNKKPTKQDIKDLVEATNSIGLDLKIL